MHGPQADREMTMMIANFRLRGVALQSVFKLVCAASVVLLAACGGGGGDPGTNIFDPAPTPGIAVAPKAADLSLALSARTLANNGINTVAATVTAVDANRNALPNIPVTVSVDSSAVAAVSGNVTDTNGVVTAAVGIGADRSNRVITVTATSGTLVKTATFQVFGAALSARSNPAVVTPGQSGEVEFVLTDSAKNAMVDQDIVVVGVGAAEVKGKTGLNGEFKYSFTAPGTDGTLSIRATSAGVNGAADVQVQSGVTSVPVALGIVRSASVSANPSVVPVNTTTTQNRVEVRAFFLTSGNAPVPNVRVRFDLDGDKQAIGGSITSGTNVVYASAVGEAVTSYIPGARFSPTDGVTIRACWSNTDFVAGQCPNQAKTTLTVISDALSVSIGTDNLVGLGDSGLDFVKRYVVQVNDSSGLAKADVQIAPSIDLLSYLKGNWEVLGDQWVQGGVNPLGVGGSLNWRRGQQTVCPNEDLNRNGVAEVYANGDVEDANGSFNLTNGRPALEPRKADVSISFEGPSRTNANGQVVLKITYPQNVASWVEFNILVAASGVAGTEGRANYRSVLPVIAAQVTDIKSRPAFHDSPYGVGYGDPSRPVTLPGNPTPTLLCTNPN